MKLNIGDIVLLNSGQKTNFFEVIKVEKNTVLLSNGWVQIRKDPSKVEIICKAENRQDKRVPFNRYVE